MLRCGCLFLLGFFSRIIHYDQKESGVDSQEPITQAVAMGGITTDKIVQDPELREIAQCLMKEVVIAANEDLDATDTPKVTDSHAI
jgi:hypothetical protein